MINVGDIVKVKESQHKIAKGQKVKLRARVVFITETGLEIANGCIISVHNGSEFKYVDLKRIKIIESDGELNPEDKITFIAEFNLEPQDMSDDSIIFKSLYTKWNVHLSDWYTKFRKENLEKYGYDTHKMIYK